MVTGTKAAIEVAKTMIEVGTIIPYMTPNDEIMIFNYSENYHK